jgi:putative peptide zinc metalloprotease protein
VLSVEGGGTVSVNPNSGDNRTTLNKYFQLEVNIPEVDNSFIDERVYLRFKHSPEAMYKRIYRSIRRVFLRVFSV